jgi:2-(1,2-epoxy-1,2-dihydrophenyl)acetyl-CoA isomerase
MAGVEVVTRLREKGADMADELVLLDQDQGVATITLNRPDRLNAMNAELGDQLRNNLRAAASDLAVRCVVLTGAGRAFCAGGDVSRMAGETAEPTYEEAVAEGDERHSVVLLVHEMRKPVIAMVNGAAAGAGLSLAMACDLRIAGAGARFGTAFMRVGYSGDYGGTWLLTQLVGTAKARELYYTADLLNAEAALSIGLVNRVVPDEVLRNDTMALAQQLASGPTVAYGYMKDNLNLSQYARLPDVVRAETRSQRRTGETDDHREGVRAFMEKRPPVFQGR